MICPVCVANAAMTVAAVGASTGGLSAIAMRILRRRKKTTGVPVALKTKEGGER